MHSASDEAELRITFPSLVVAVETLLYVGFCLGRPFPFLGLGAFRALRCFLVGASLLSGFPPLLHPHPPVARLCSGLVARPTAV